jgi:sarcosine oxidase
LRPHTPVRSIRPVGGAVDVVTDEGTEHFDAVVLACDAWVNRLLAPLGHDVPLIVLREQVSYFPAADLGPFQPGRFPVWIWMDDPCFYGFPVYGDTAAVKAAEDCGGPEVDPDDRGFEPDPAAEARVAQFMRRLVGNLLTSAPRSTTCLYTLTADRDFVLDRLPDHPHCSSPSARPTGSSSRRGSVARWRSSSSTAAHPTTSPRTRSRGPAFAHRSIAARGSSEPLRAIHAEDVA